MSKYNSGENPIQKMSEDNAVYKCPVSGCGKLFGLKKALSIHMQVHRVSSDCQPVPEKVVPNSESF